jgi:AcrR family transcriptional regulator
MLKNRPPLTREHILEAALKILDEQGTDGLSMRKLASILNVKAMSLYNHVKDKLDLLSGLCDLVLSRIELPDASLPWSERLETIAMNLYGALIQHPAIVLILVSEKGRPSELKVLEGMDSLVAILAESGLSPHQQGQRLSRAARHVLWIRSRPHPGLEQDQRTGPGRVGQLGQSPMERRHTPAPGAARSTVPANARGGRFQIHVERLSQRFAGRLRRTERQPSLK